MGTNLNVMDDDELRAAWNGLSKAAQQVLRHLCTKGPQYDGDVASKWGRDELLEKRLAAKIIMGPDWVCPRDWKEPRPVCEWGFQAATYLGAHVWKAGEVEPRKEIVRMLVGAENVRSKP